MVPLAIDQYISINRGKGYMNFSFVPIVRRHGKLQKLVSARILIIPDELPARRTVSRTRMASERYADNSVLSYGMWKKIHITKDGMYRLSPEFLSKMGFQDPARVHLYGYGGHQQDEV